jgi:hypothetical protein
MTRSREAKPIPVIQNYAEYMEYLAVIEVVKFLTVNQDFCNVIIKNFILWQNFISQHFTYLKDKEPNQFTKEPYKLFIQECQRCAAQSVDYKLKPREWLEVLKGNLEIIDTVTNPLDDVDKFLRMGDLPHIMERSPRKTQRARLYTLALSAGHVNVNETVREINKLNDAGPQLVYGNFSNTVEALYASEGVVPYALHLAMEYNDIKAIQLMISNDKHLAFVFLVSAIVGNNLYLLQKALQSDFPVKFSAEEKQDALKMIVTKSEEVVELLAPRP